MILLLLLLSVSSYDGIIPETTISAIVIGRTGCSACVKMEPIVKELQNEQYNIYYTKDNDIRKRYNIYAVPTTIILEEGEEINRIEGFLSRDKLIKLLGKK
jgi:thiol-disulfide isomerase/thioredoxin